MCVRVGDLIAVTWLGPRPEGQDLRHLDGNPSNDTLDNLAWGTPAEVAQDYADRAAREGPATCALGHPLADTWLGSWGERVCPTCKREANRRSKTRTQRPAGDVSGLRRAGRLPASGPVPTLRERRRSREVAGETIGGAGTGDARAPSTHHRAAAAAHADRSTPDHGGRSRRPPTGADRNMPGVRHRVRERPDGAVGEALQDLPRTGQEAAVEDVGAGAPDPATTGAPDPNRPPPPGIFEGPPALTGR
ncbi:HNH endonuclease [Tsukamurella paurometabola]|uniref:HNH endonuclease n=1 Tax=Tsukamurella paurometabola TaxID=2061 RepID=A0ABS5NIB4_TSUPA|nr:HNH endonuclease [Tsukamurella paurometabola]